ncbi:MAG TPA: hypothetical protein P5307_25545, partial [Pirellulaceae bacterium]|nr:hypothetical protein [Pirellulaceae bacterium]
MTVSSSRANAELAGQLRRVTMQLQQDLEGVTVPLRTWTQLNSALGYFEYHEGAETDYNVASPRVDSHVGDVDDILMFTTRNAEHPFRGQINSAYLNGISPQSTVADVIWWVRLDDLNSNGTWDSGERFTIHRRALLVLPELNDSGSLPVASSIAQFAAFVHDNDLSVRLGPVVGGGRQIVANSLDDLSNRANRFAHISYGDYGQGGFPFILDKSGGLLSTAYALTGARMGEDRIMANCVGWDVRVYDPLAIVKTDANGIDSLGPGDPGYGASGATSVGTGAYVDLNYATTLGLSTTSVFSGAPLLRSGLSGTTGTSLLPPRKPYSQPTGQVSYDTWSQRYEQNGVNEDSLPTPTSVVPLFPEELLDPFVDEATDGEDNLEYVSPATGTFGRRYGVDDVGERETSPPYP